MRIKTKITLFLFIFTIGLLATAGIFTTLTLKRYINDKFINDLEILSNQIEYLLRTIPENHEKDYMFLQNYAHSANARLTLINSDGKVIFESEVPETQLPSIENHFYRKEIQVAYNKGTGTDIRKSATIDVDILYFARILKEQLPQSSRFKETKFIRVGFLLTYVKNATTDIINKVVFTGIIVLFVISFFIFYISRKICSPIEEMSKIAEEVRKGNIDLRIPVKSKDEIGEFAETFNKMLDKLHEDINKLKKLETIRSEFLGNVSHELRTPIFAIQGMLETLLQGALDDSEVGRDFVQRALANTQRLNTLLNDLIEISRIESGDMKMSFRYFEINSFLSQIITEMEPIANQRGIKLEVSLAEQNVDVYGDKERIKQAIINLIDNAIKYNKPNGKVVVCARKCDQELKIIIEDTGVGIADEHIPRIFERFYRVDKERSREAGGTGLGLAIVKHIVEAHGSRVEVQSKKGEWSKFSFTLKI